MPIATSSLVLAFLAAASPCSTERMAAFASPRPALFGTDTQKANAPLPLADMPELSGTALAPFTLEAPVRKASGEIFGSVSFLGSSARAMLHPVQQDIDGGNAGWILTIEASSARLSDLVPALEKTIAGELRLGPTAVVLSTGNVRVDEATMSRDVAAFYAPYFRSARLMLEVAGGVNLVTRMEPGEWTPLGRALDLLGIETDGVLLQGTVLKDASFSDLKRAHEDKELRKRLEESMELRAYLPAVRLAELSDRFVTGETSLIVGGKPSVGLAFRLVADGGDAGNSQSFECRVDVAEVRPGVTEVQVLGTALGTWRDVLGIQGLHLNSPRLLLEIDTAQRVGFGLRGGLSIGSREMALAAKLQLHAVTGAPVGGFFEGRLDSIGSADLVSFATALGSARGKRPMPASNLPEFELRDLYLKIAPTEGDSDLGTSEGFAIRGQLYAMEQEIAYVDGAISLGGVIPSLSLVGACKDIDLGAIALKGASVDIRLGATLDQHFRLKGSTKLLALSRSVDIDCSLTNLVIDTTETFDGVYSIAYHLSSPSNGRPSWRVNASFENQLSRTLNDQVAGKARAWAEEVERDFAKAQTNLDKAKGKVKQLDLNIEAQKKVVLDRRESQRSGIQKAQNKVAEITGKMNAARARIEGKRKAHKNKMDQSKRASDKARKAWKKAIQDRKRASLIKVPKMKAIEAAKYADYGAKNAAYLAVKASYETIIRVPVEADPVMMGLLGARESATVALKAAEKMTEAWPIETDPKVASLIAGRAAALAGLEIAKAAVHVAGKAANGASKITGWLAKHNGDLFMLDAASFEAKLAGYLAGNSVQLDLKTRFVGEPKAFKLMVSTGVLRDGELARSVWRHLKKELQS